MVFVVEPIDIRKGKFIKITSSEKVFELKNKT